MKKLLFFACVLFFISCNNNDGKTETVDSDSTTVKTEEPSAARAASYEYPYTLDNPYNDWQPGDQQHAVNVMKSLRAYEMNDIPGAISYFGDSVELRFDGFDEKVVHDSVTPILTGSRNEYAKFMVQMRDWESVISKDKKEEWVTMWYKQIWTDKNGKTDSASVINDAKIKNGKIVVLEETMRKYGKRK